MAAWQILFCLTVLSFVSRAFIPIGYMPGLSGERDSTFAITLCSMGGATTVMTLDLSGDSADSGPEDPYGIENCPFGPGVVHKFAPGQDAAEPVGITSFSIAAAPVGFRTLPPLPALGPPLGSRAPPSIAALHA